MHNTAALRASRKEALSTLVEGGRTQVDLGETWLAPVVSLPVTHPVEMVEVRESGPVEIGQVVADRYRVERELGSGAFGHVYLVRHITLEANFALKVLRPEALRDDPSLIDRFKREAWATAQVPHPGIVQVTDVAQLKDDRWYIIMEYLQGRSLADELEALRKGDRLAISRVVQIIREVAEAMWAAHLQGIVHRDLKPENIYLVRLSDGAERVKVVDFGLALSVRAESASVPGEISGSPMYMAPEQVAGLPADPRSDVYTLAVILFECLANRWPHEMPVDGTGNERIQKICSARGTEVPPLVSEFREGVPEGIVKLLRDALEINPDRRPQSMAEFNDRLRAAMMVRSAGSRNTAPVRSRSALGTIVGLLVVVVVLAVGIVGWRTADPASYAEFRGVVSKATQVIRKVGGPVVERVREELRDIKLPEFLGGEKPTVAPVEAPKVEVAPKSVKAEAPTTRKPAKRRAKKVRGAATALPDASVAAPPAAPQP